METLRERIIRHEGLRLRPYHDSLGKLTIGVGRCLETRGISEEEAFYLLDNDIEQTTIDVEKYLPWTINLDKARKEVLIEMAFQLGVQGLLTFKNTLAFIQKGEWQKAYENMLQSLWHRQTPKRAEELATIILNGGN